MNRVYQSLKNNKKACEAFIILAIAFIVITIFSENSFLYNWNDSPDVNYELQIGRQVLNGRVLYVDAYEHRGPYCIAIYTFANLFGNFKYKILYLIEIITAFFSLYYLNETLRIKGFKNTIVPTIMSAFLIYGASYFVYGGSCAEEWCLPFLIYSYYVMTKHIYENKDISSAELLFIGITSGIVFMQKYPLCLFYLAWFLYYFIRNKIKAFFAIPKIILGVLISFIPAFIYFAVNHATYTFVTEYILGGISYGQQSTSSVPIDVYLLSIVLNVAKRFLTCSVVFVLLFLSFLLKSNKERLFAFLLLLTAIIYARIGLFSYCFIVFSYLMPFAISSLCVLLNTVKSVCTKTKLFAVIDVLLCASIIYYSYCMSPNVYKLTCRTSDNYLLEAYEYMHQNNDNPNVLSAKIDGTPYFAYTDSFPDETYFVINNNGNEEYINYFLSKIENGEPDYIIDYCYYNAEIPDGEISAFALEHGYVLSKTYQFMDADCNKTLFILSKSL